MVSPATSNDTRGWVLCLISAAACVAGACIVCVDIFIRLLPGKKNFSIQDSSAFLSSSLSLSFGVMIFSSLSSMLPSSKRYLLKDGHSDQTAGLLMIAGFAVGFVGMQVISRVIHRFMPSHVVDCDHSHEDDVDASAAASAGTGADAHLDHASVPGTRSRPYSLRASRHSSHRSSHHSSRPSSSGAGATATEATPLLADASLTHRPLHGNRSQSSLRRPSMVEIQNRVLSFVKDVKSNCDESGSCFGYTDPCGQECKRIVALRAPLALLHPEWERVIPMVPEAEEDSVTHDSQPETGAASPGLHDPHDHQKMPEGEPDTSCAPSGGESSTNVSNYGGVDNSIKDDHVHAHAHTHTHTHGHGHGHGHGHIHTHTHTHTHTHDHGAEYDGDIDVESGLHEHAHAHQQQHHHHVPANAFLSIGLQTVLAIGLHKFPEGFITFATNHANPTLGFNVFMALFVHNIAEGFAMALPLYMALGSRLKAILWSAALGGLSQPLGAGVAALWLQYLGRGDRGSADELGTAYGVLFAVTAGIMVAVALQLFVESLTLHHNRQLTIGFAFVGMMMLGLSNAIGSH